MKLRWQLAIALATLAGAAALTASLAAYSSTSRQLNSETDAFLYERLNEITEFDSFFSRGGPDFGPFADDGFDFGGSGFPFARPDANTTYINSDGSTRASLSATDIPITDADQTVALSGGDAVTRTVTVADRPYRVLTAPLDNDDPSAGAVQLSRDITESERLLDALRWRLSIITVMVTAGAALVGWTLARQLAKPLERLRNAATGVALTKTFDVRLPTNTSGEVKEVTESFNTMLAELDDSRRRQHQLVQDANHELRTPLATLSANLELLQRIAPDNPERDEILSDAQAELTELTELTNQLTAAASLQYDPSARHRIGLDIIVNTAVEQFAASNTCAVGVSVTDASDVNAAPGLLERAVINLLTNANKHASSDASIDVHVDRSTVLVRDRGPGIDPEDLERIFESFYRSTRARTLPGSGLGLPLARQIVEDHGGSITARNHPDGGAEFTMAFPADAN